MQVDASFVKDQSQLTQVTPLPCLITVCVEADLSNQVTWVHVSCHNRDRLHPLESRLLPKGQWLDWDMQTYSENTHRNVCSVQIHHQFSVQSGFSLSFVSASSTSSSSVSTHAAKHIIQVSCFHTPQNISLPTPKNHTYSFPQGPSPSIYHWLSCPEKIPCLANINDCELSPVGVTFGWDACLYSKTMSHYCTADSSSAAAGTKFSAAAVLLLLNVCFVRQKMLFLPSNASYLNVLSAIATLDLI